MKVLFLLLFLSAAILAQNSNSLRQKYGEPFSETFKVRPQILLTVKYAKTGVVCSMGIEPQTFRVGDLQLGNTRLIEDKLLNEILEELAPENQRGKFVVGTTRMGVPVEDYERVEIYRRGKPDKRSYAGIFWKIEACEN
jgi:hypothetical protein